MQNKKWCAAALLVLPILHNLARSNASSETPSYYTAAVFEYVKLQNCTSDPVQAKKVLKFNANFFAKAAKIAKSKGADIIVFPEYGLFPECNRTETTVFCEKIPADPKERANPCIEAKRFSKSPALRKLSCIARKHSMVVQANMAEYLPCQGEPGCPAGSLQFNTNVVFDRDGSLINRYRKEHLWNEGHFDIPRKKQDPKFTVDFGTFLSYVCYDLFLARVIEVLTEDVDGIVFSTFWENTMPFGMTVQFFESFAISMNTTLLAACLQMAGQWAVGSGIFSGPYGALAYTFDPDGLNKLVVARVPRRNHVLENPMSSTTVVNFNGTVSDWESDGDNIPEDGSDLVLSQFSRHHNTELHYHVIDMENHTLHKITQSSDSIEECNNGLCCSLEYSADAITESIYLAVFKGLQETFYPYYFGQEDCMLVRCNDVDGKECVSFPMWSKDLFYHFTMTANFSTPFIYPSIVNDHFRLLPYKKWDYNIMETKDGFQGSIGFDSKKGQPLVVGSLNGRLYREDPRSSFF